MEGGTVELRHFRYFDALAAERHFGRAAARLGITQPTLTRQIQDLEAEVGVRLLHRTRGGVVLSPAGSQFLEEARIALAAAERSSSSARQASREVAGTLTLATLATSLLAVLVPVLPELRRKHPRVAVRLRTTLPGAEQIAAVRSGDLDAGFVFLPIQAPDLLVEPVLEDPLVAAVPPSFRLPGRSPLPFRALDDVPLVTFPRTRAPAFHDLVADLFRRERMRMRIGAETDSYSSVLGLVAAGMGVAVLPSTLAAFRIRGVRYHPFEPGVPSVELALLRRREPPNPALAALLAEVRRVAAPRSPSPPRPIRPRSAPSSRAARRP
jgi:DNA-binding transcriptional LysR family regulator